MGKLVLEEIFSKIYIIKIGKYKKYDIIIVYKKL